MNAIINKKIVLAASLVAGLLLVVALPAFAAAPRHARLSRANQYNGARSASITASGTVVTVSGSWFTMNATTGQTYTVNAGSAVISMKDGSSLPAANIEINDSVTVLGALSGATINATQITDSSLWRFERVSGTVLSVSGASFSLQTNDRGTVTVNIAGNARVSRDNGLYNNYAYPVVGEYANATGTWDQANRVLWTTDVRVSSQSSNNYNGYNGYNGYSNYNNNANGSVSLSLSPSVSTLANNQSTTITASGYDNNGVSSIIIYVNGSAAQTCTPASYVVNYNCTTTIYGGNYLNGAAIAIYARLADQNGNIVNSSTATVYAQSNQNNNVNNGSVSLSLSPHASTLASGQSTTVTATVSDPNGVTATNIYVNGSLAMPCPVTAAPTTNYCTVILYGSNYASGSTVSVYAQATDVYSNTFTSSTSYLTVNGATAAPTVNQYATLSLYPYVSTLGTAQSTTVTAAASDMNGVSAIGIYANGALVKTCPFGGSITSASCAYNLAGSNYAVGSTVSLYAKATGINGNVTTSSTANLTIVNASSDTVTTTASLIPRYGERRNGHRWDGQYWR